MRNRVPIEAKVFGSVGLLALLAAGGYVLSSAPAGGTAGGVKAQAMTIEKQVVTVEKRISVGGRTRTVRRRVPVVQRVVVTGRPGTTLVLTTAVTRPVRVLERQVVTADGTIRTRTLKGPISTVVRTITGQTPATATTVVRTITGQTPATPATPTTRTVTNDREVTSIHTVTGDPVTSTRTVTAEPTTVLSTTTKTVTTTVTETETTTLPAVTVTDATTVTVTVPKR